MITVWRICQKRRVRQTFTGIGAKMYGGRWSPPGVPVVYTAESKALAALEVLVHVNDPAELVRRQWIVIPIILPDNLVEDVEVLPINWKVYPAPDSLREIGANWAVSMASVVLRVPSAVVSGEFNYLLNPLHANFRRLKIGPAERFFFDIRLVT